MGGKNMSEDKGTQAETVLEEAKQDVRQEAKGIYVHAFKKTFEYEGKTYEALTFYWDRLTGRDMIAIENEMLTMNEYALAPEISSSFLCRLAARAAGIGSDVLESMPISDFGRIKNAARDFLISTGY
jgi:hypothetical protein